VFFPLPTAYCLLPIAYCLLPTAYCLLPIAYCLLPTAYCPTMELQISDLACIRGGRQVFAGLSLRADGGSLTLLRGANGAGKTSLLRLIAGIAEPDRGRIALLGGDAALTLSQQCHFIGDRDATKLHLTIAENLRFWGAFLDGGDLDRALDSFGLKALANLQAAVLSSGQRRRLALSRLALVARPLWLLDEPTVGLDAASRDRLAALMAAHLATGGIIIAATHVELGLAGIELRLGEALVREVAAQ
jgi:heme exporter protein A